MALPKLRIPRRRRRRPRILLCTPEITELPEGLGNAANWIRAKGGGLGDISAGLISHLHRDERYDLHIAVPKYDRQIVGLGGVGIRELDQLGPTLQRRGVHLVRDSAFSTSPGVYAESDAHPRVQRAVAFQRTIINQLLDDVRPDIVHCNDWMTGLVPAAAKARGIHSVFTIHNVFTELASPDELDRAGIDVRRYLTDLYFEHYPGGSFEDTWFRNRADFAASGIFAADMVNTVSPSFLEELVEGVYDDVVPLGVVRAIRDKHAQGRALGILNAPNDTVDPRHPRWAERFAVADVMDGKRRNKAIFQQRMGLTVDPAAPLFLWPNRLYSQKGVRLLIDLMQSPLAERMQVAVVANGDARTEEQIGVLALGSQGRIARQPFREQLSELGKAGSDYLLMPSRYEPCGLPQMEGPRFGTLPVVRSVGGLKDTVPPLDAATNTGVGFTFSEFTAEAFGAAVARAIAFHDLGAEVREQTLQRVMREAFEHHSLARVASHYVEVYESLL
ncbi:MAG: glycogen/starch synthase [Myxococcota bacterium]